MKIFCSLNRVSDNQNFSKWISVNDAESNGIKILTWFPGSSILEISIKIYYCVGSARMRRRFCMKVYIFDFKWPYAIWTHGKPQDSFCDKTIFAQSSPTTRHGQSDLKFYSESYDARIFGKFSAFFCRTKYVFPCW